MVARLFSAAMRAIDAGGDQRPSKVRSEHQEVHAEAGIAPERRIVYPEGVDALLGMQMPCGIDPSLLQQPAERGARFGPHYGVQAQKPFVVDVGLGRNHVQVARQYHGPSRIDQSTRVRVEALEPGELVVELRPRLG